MAERDFSALFAEIREFGWDPRKRESNLQIHRIDFEDVKEIFDGYSFVRRSDRHGEVRYQIFGYVRGRQVTVVCTLRGALCWIISARHPSRSERRKYHDRLAGLAPPGEN